MSSHNVHRQHLWIIALLIAVAIVVLAVVVALPEYSRAHRLARETAALKTVRIIQQTQVQYQAQHGRCARSLEELAAAGLISSDTLSEMQEHRFVVTGAPAGYMVGWRDDETKGTWNCSCGVSFACSAPDRVLIDPPAPSAATEPNS